VAEGACWNDRGACKEAAVKPSRWTVVAALVTAIVSMAGAPAQASAGGHPLVPASGRLAGIGGGQLLGKEFRYVLSLPVAKNPLAGAGGSCFTVGNRQVLIVWTRPTAPTCTTTPNTPIFLFTFYSECSKAEPPPFFGGTAAAQRQCAIDTLRAYAADNYRAMDVSIDGGSPTDVYSHRYLAVSPQMKVQLPAPNILGVTASRTTFVAAAWVAMIRPLPPGTHEIKVELVHLDGTSDVSRIIVKISGGQRVDE
jgi:hypothetical protein